MSIVLISSAPHGSGLKLAQNLSEKTDWPLYSRELVAQKAHETGIRLSRLETSIIKSPVISEKLAREKGLYLALVTKILCEQSKGQSLIYHGRAAHLLLPGIPGVIRVGLETPIDTRVENVMRDLNLTRAKARDYLDQLDEDIEKWVHYIHQESLQNPSSYDLFLNLSHLTLENAASILDETAALPVFKPTMESSRKLDDRCLAANAKIHLARNPATSGLDLGVRAVNGVVTVTYMPRQVAAADNISQALRGLKGCRENICTMAETNILWIQENFDPRGENFDQVTSLAKRWGAAIELLQLDSSGSQVGQLAPMENNGLAEPAAYTGGVEDDDPYPAVNDHGLLQTVDELVAIGRSAGGFSVSGGGRDVIDAVKDNNNYSLIILGDIFLSKGHETSTRETRELGMTLKERLKAPVITSKELHSKFLFGKAQALKLLTFALASLLIYGLVFTFQKPILDILGGDLHAKFKWAAAIGVALFVPIVAYVYGTVTGLVLKLIDID
ncbi:AAA family ATPase [Desulfospira joergensenii]|uniref:cytidylate kinase-like family protein n=1 Tax=Desulfospira joergensenii TaxID=53329 RepID=UPI0003B4FC13|nr:cytidylate kinase-like family protein [Desulfospira joergensenii]